MEASTVISLEEGREDSVKALIGCLILSRCTLQLTESAFPRPHWLLWWTGLEFHPGNWVSVLSRPSLRGSPLTDWLWLGILLGRLRARRWLVREGCGGGDKAAEASPRGCEPACEWEEATAAGLRCEEERATADSKSGKGGERERERGVGCWKSPVGGVLAPRSRKCVWGCGREVSEGPGRGAAVRAPGGGAPLQTTWSSGDLIGSREDALGPGVSRSDRYDRVGQLGLLHGLGLFENRRQFSSSLFVLPTFFLDYLK